MKTGLYRIVFTGFGDAAAGVAVVQGAELVGGDSSYYYTGALDQVGERLTAQIVAVRHSAGPGSTFGPLPQVTLKLSGPAAGMPLRLTGSAREMPAVSAAVTLSEIAPFDESAHRPREATVPRPAAARAAPARQQDCPFVSDEDGEGAGEGRSCADVAWLNQPLSDLHLRVLNILWRVGEATVVDLHQALAGQRSIAPSTLAHAMAVMEKRRLVSHRSQGQRHVYRAEASREEFLKSMARTLTAVADTLYEGDRGRLIGQLIQTAPVSRGELDRLRVVIGEAAMAAGGARTPLRRGAP